MLVLDELEHDGHWRNPPRRSENAGGLIVGGTGTCSGVTGGCGCGVDGRSEERAIASIAGLLEGLILSSDGLLILCGGDGLLNPRRLACSSLYPLGISGRRRVGAPVDFRAVCLRNLCLD